jgi:hypothetical protein
MGFFFLLEYGQSTIFSFLLFYLTTLSLTSQVLELKQKQNEVVG